VQLVRDGYSIVSRIDLDIDIERALPSRSRFKGQIGECRTSGPSMVNDWEGWVGVQG